MLAIHTGLRQGELLALKWEDLDLEARTLRVRRTLTYAGGKHSIAEPKTKKSRRTVRLTTAGIAALRDHLERQMGGDGGFGLILQAQRARLRQQDRRYHQPLKPP